MRLHVSHLDVRTGAAVNTFMIHLQGPFGISSSESVDKRISHLMIVVINLLMNNCQWMINWLICWWILMMFNLNDNGDWFTNKIIMIPSMINNGDWFTNIIIMIASMIDNNDDELIMIVYLLLLLSQGQQHQVNQLINLPWNCQISHTAALTVVETFMICLTISHAFSSSDI